MVFTKRGINSNIDIKTDNNTVSRVYVSKLLGGFIDYKLSWKEHVSMIKSKVSKICCHYVYSKTCA